MERSLRIDLVKRRRIRLTELWTFDSKEQERLLCVSASKTKCRHDDYGKCDTARLAPLRGVPALDTDLTFQL